MAAALAMAIGVGGCGESSSPPSFPGNPILFVHGIGGEASNWGPMIARFEQDGYPNSYLLAYTYSSAVSNEADAKGVKSHVESLLKTTGASKVDIVAHSMGSLNTRWYIKFDGGESKVDDWVSLGGPNHGLVLPHGFSFPSLCAPCMEMRPGSAFLRKLNAGDETPGPVHYGTWRSPCDEIINPDESVILRGATNRKTTCMSHPSLLTDETVYEQVREFVK